MAATSLDRWGGAAVCAGDAVALSIAERGLARTAACAFGAPLAVLLIGAWYGGIAGGEHGSVLFGFFGLAAGLAWIMRSGERLLNTLNVLVQVGDRHGPCDR